MRITQCFQKWKPMIWVVTCSISWWTSVHSVSHNAGSLWTQFITFFDVKSSFSIAFFFLCVMTSTNNKIRNENPASTGSLAGSKRVFFYIPFLKHAHKPNQRTCCINLDMSRATRFSTKKVKSWSKACRKPARTCRKPGRNRPGLQPARIMECGLNEARRQTS